MVKRKKSSSIEDCLRNVRSKVPKPTTVSLQPPPPDKRGVKRVRFMDPDALPDLPPLTSKPSTCSTRLPPVLDKKGGYPKTDEYKYYKRFREDAAHSYRSYQMHKQDKQLEKSEAYTKELTKRVKSKYDLGSLSPIEKGSPIGNVSFLPPTTSMNSGSNSEQKDIFSIKRQKLLHLTAESLSLDIEKLCSKGYDLVSILLQRLVPESNAVAEPSCSASRSRSNGTKFNSNYQLDVSLDSDIHSAEAPQTQNMGLISPFAAEKSFKNDLSESWSSRSRECNLLQEVGEDMGSLLTWHPNGIYPEFDRNPCCSILDCGETLGLHNKRDSFSGVYPIEEFSSNRDGYLALEGMSNQSRLLCPTDKELSIYYESLDKTVDQSNRSSFKNVNSLCSPNEFASDSKQCSLFLDWGSNIIEKERDLSNSSYSVIPNITQTQRTSLDTNLKCQNCIPDQTGTYSQPARGIHRSSDIALGLSSGWQPGNMLDFRETPSFHTKRISCFAVHPIRELSMCRDGYLASDHTPDESRLFYSTSKKLSFHHGSPESSFGQSSTSGFKKLDGLCSPNELASDSEQCPLLLLSASKSIKKEQHLFNSSSDVVPHCSQTWVAPSEDNLQTLNSILDATGMYASPAQSIHRSTDNNSRNMPLENYLIERVRRQVPEEESLFDSFSVVAPNISPTWRISSEDNLQSLNCIFDATRMFSPPTRSSYHSSDVLGNMTSGTHLIDTVGRQAAEDREYRVEEPDDFPVTICCTPGYLSLGKRRRLSNIMEETSIIPFSLGGTKFISSIMEDISIIPSPGSGTRFISETFSRGINTGLGTHRISPLKLDYGCDSLPASDYCKELQLSSHSGLQLLREGTRRASAFLVARDVTETYMDSLSSTNYQTQLAEDSFHSSNLMPLTFKIPFNENFDPLSLSESSRSGEESCDHSGNIARQLLIVDSLL